MIKLKSITTRPIDLISQLRMSFCSREIFFCFFNFFPLVHIPTSISQAFDTIMWQTFASVFVPGFTINRVVKACGYGLKNYGKSLPPPLVRWLPTAVGIGIIPFIIHPIDDLVHFVMDKSIRTLYR